MKSQRQNLRQTILGIILFFAFTGCGKEDESKEKDEDTGTGTVAGSGGTPVSNQASIVGTWSLSGVIFKESTDDSVVIKGINEVSFRANGTWNQEIIAFTSSTSGNTYYQNCTSYSSGLFQVSNGSLIMTETVHGGISGSCADVDSPSLETWADSSRTVSMSDGKLLLAHETTYEANDGSSKPFTEISTFSKKSEETWDGNGMDTRLQGSWKLSKVVGQRLCKQSNTDGWEELELAISGSHVSTISGNTFQTTQTDFALGAGTKCTATDSGTIEASKLTNIYKQTTSSDECIVEEPDPQGYILAIDRQFVTDSGKIINFFGSQQPDDDCEYDKSYAMAVIGITEKQ